MLHILLIKTKQWKNWWEIYQIVHVEITKNFKEFPVVYTKLLPLSFVKHKSLNSTYIFPMIEVKGSRCHSGKLCAEVYYSDHKTKRLSRKPICKYPKLTVVSQSHLNYLNF